MIHSTTASPIWDIEAVVFFVLISCHANQFSKFTLLSIMFFEISDNSTIIY